VSGTARNAPKAMHVSFVVFNIYIFVIIISSIFFDKLIITKKKMYKKYRE
jgi:hypothetical protein